MKKVVLFILLTLLKTNLSPLIVTSTVMEKDGKTIHLFGDYHLFNAIGRNKEKPIINHFKKLCKKNRGKNASFLIEETLEGHNQFITESLGYSKSNFFGPLCKITEKYGFDVTRVDQHRTQIRLCFEGFYPKSYKVYKDKLKAYSDFDIHKSTLYCAQTSIDKVLTMLENLYLIKELKSDIDSAINDVNLLKNNIEFGIKHSLEKTIFSGEYLDRFDHPLVELITLSKILESKNNTVAVFMGNVHTNVLMHYLYKIGYTIKYNQPYLVTSYVKKYKMSQSSSWDEVVNDINKIFEKNIGGINSEFALSTYKKNIENSKIERSLKMNFAASKLFLPVDNSWFDRIFN